MKRHYSVKGIFIVLIVGLALAVGCANSPSTTAPAGTTAVTAVQNIDTQKAFDLIQKNRDNPEFVILDVRTPDEFRGGHIPKAINIDVNSADFRSEIGKLDRNKAYLVYCRSGVRSAQASEIMSELGFKNIFNLLQGYNQWVAGGYPTE